MTLRMISRYKRKPVLQNLQISSFPKATDNHPLLDTADSFLTSLNTEQYATSLQSGRSEASRSAENSQDSWLEYQRGTGFSTDNSSVVSWGFDEFDQAATRQMQRIFKHIDELLYEEKASPLVEDLQEECQQWTSRFPHLRIQGKQILAPSDDGYSWHPSYPRSASASTPKGCASARDVSELGVFGSRCSFAIANDPNTDVSFCLGSDKELEDDVGVIVSEGVMEEYLAFDCRNKDDELFEWSRAASLDTLKMGHPPISPKYCNKVAVLAFLFDDVWREVVGSLEELVCRHWEESITDDDTHAITIKTTRVECVNLYAPSQRLPLVLPPVTNARIPAISPKLSTHSHGGNIAAPRHLNDLMVIHGIPLQQRNLPLMEKVLDSGEKSPLRPTSAAVISGKPRQGRSLEHSSSSLSHNTSSARRRNPPRTLHPINNNPSRSGTPKMEEVIKGTRLHATYDQMPCSPLSFNRNNLLPPIGTTDLERQSTQGSQRQTPDTQLERSFVVSDHRNTFQNRRGSDGVDSISIGVTGISLGTASASSARSVQWGHSFNEFKAVREAHSSGISLHLPLRSHSRGGFLTRSRQGL
ncbi:primary cilium assembly protein FAM149B1 [Spea bombifrons]|uniref:primary cilium assembly protein FAM149B1 n=1 Tax=Spea bombifrons TaxID=233779 RepID=UPI00234A312E|nr:primary cilium assembly protein FAM149B1 [Spea bombifrons]